MNGKSSKRSLIVNLMKSRNQFSRWVTGEWVKEAILKRLLQEKPCKEIMWRAFIIQIKLV